MDSFTVMLHFKDKNDRTYVTAAIMNPPVCNSDFVTDTPFIIDSIEQMKELDLKLQEFNIVE